MARANQSAVADRFHWLYPVLTLALTLLALTAVIASPPERRLMTVLVAAPMFALMQWLVPKCRLRAEHYFSPVNVALLLFFVKLIVAPILVMTVGAGNSLFVAVPSREAMDGAVMIDLIAYIALCLGLAFAPQGHERQRSSSTLAMLSETPGSLVVIVFAAMGLLGFFLAFGSPGRIVQYFLEPSTVKELVQEHEGSWSGFLGIILRPFLAFALVTWWARSVDRSGRTRSLWRPMVAGAIAAIGITMANLTFSFNRAAFVFPVVSLVAVYSARIRRIPPLVTAAALALLLPVLFAVGNYRASMMAGVAVTDGASAFQTSLREASETVQAYAGGPPLAGLFLDEQKWGAHLYGGFTLVASVLSPIPILGKDFRDASGSALYNQALYGMPGFDDQIIPFSAELFVNFHAAGVLAGFFVLGLVLGQAEIWIAAVGSSFGAFAVQYVSIWCAMLAVWSLSIFSQIAIYFLGPIYLYWAAVQARTFLRGMRVQRAVISLS